MLLHSLLQLKLDHKLLVSSELVAFGGVEDNEKSQFAPFTWWSCLQIRCKPHGCVINDLWYGVCTDQRHSFVTQKEQMARLILSTAE